MNILIYLLQVSACTAVFYLFYYLFLNKLTFFTTNRWYLLATLLVSFVIPLITLPVDNHPYVAVVQQVMYTTTQQGITINTQPIVVQSVKHPHIDWMLLLKLVYLAAVVVLSVHLLVVLIAFFRRLKLKGKQIAKVGKVTILSAHQKISNGSFLNYIFLNDAELSAHEMQQVIAHEMLHVKLYHSADRILVRLAQIVLWFNPFIYLYSRSIEENHEFEVDKEIALSTDKHNYASLLLHLSVAGHGTLYNNFSKVPLKKRINMIFNKPTAKMKKIIYVLILPVVTISCLAFARLKTDDNKKFSVIKGVEKLGNNPLVVINGKIYSKDILYKISSSCITGTTVFNPDATVKKEGVFIKDGYIRITTKGNKITYLTAIEKENLVKERSLPQSQFYNRITLKKNDGTIYDKIIMHPLGGSISCGIPHNAKAAYFIDNKFYDENGIKNLPATTIAAIHGEYSVEGNKHFWPQLKEYTAVFHFNTNKVTSDSLDITPPVIYKGNEKIFPADDLKGANINKESIPDGNEVVQLYSRVEMKKTSGKVYDVVKVHIRKDGTAGAMTEVPHNAKVGFFLDHDFYTEDQFNKLAPKVKATLFASQIRGVAEAKYFPIIHKEGYTADLTGYAAVFEFDYKHSYLRDAGKVIFKADSLRKKK